MVRAVGPAELTLSDGCGPAKACGSKPCFVSRTPLVCNLRREGAITGLGRGMDWREPPEMDLTDLTWPTVAELSKDMPVVIPVAALEQHGHHLPLFTDSLLTAEIVRRTAERLGGRVLFAPLTWLGN